jgi:hypothetical protein
MRFDVTNARERERDACSSMYGAVKCNALSLVGITGLVWGFGLRQSAGNSDDCQRSKVICSSLSSP